MSKSSNKKDLRKTRDAYLKDISLAIKVLHSIALDQNDDDYARDEVLQRAAPMVDPAKVLSWGYAKNDLDSTESGGYIYGPPIEGGSMRLIPAMTFTVRRTGDRPYAKFRVLLVEAANSPRQRGKEERWIGGWRFECPEWIAGPPDGPIPKPGAHDYYHAQAIIGRIRDDEKAMRAGEAGDIQGFTWSQLDTTQPAFPLAARNPFELVMAMLVSLYSLDQLKRALKRDRMEEGSHEAVGNFLKMLACPPPGEP